MDFNSIFIVKYNVFKFKVTFMGFLFSKFLSIYCKSKSYGWLKNKYYSMCNFYTLAVIFVKILKMKKLLFFSALVLGLVSCKKEVGTEGISTEVNKTGESTVSRLAANEKVKLLKARTVATYYASSYIKEKAFYAEVAKTGNSRQVFVHHKMSNGSWRDFPLSFVKAAENNSEIWGWEMNYGVGTPLATTFSNVGFSDEFVLKYVVDGQVFWDNNFGKNYAIANPLITDGMYMQEGLNISADTYHSNFSGTGNNLQIYADLKNLNYRKEVTLVYTTDNWITVKYAPLAYGNTYGYGGSNTIAEPNSKKFEKWYANIPMSSTVNKVNYALRYLVNGVEYWDNNYGRNYTINKK